MFEAEDGNPVLEGSFWIASSKKMFNGRKMARRHNFPKLGIEDLIMLGRFNPSEVLDALRFCHEIVYERKFFKAAAVVCVCQL